MRGGEGTTTVHGGRVVHVSTQADAHRPTASQQAHSGGDLHEGVSSPGSTPVMTKMSYISQVFSNHTLGGDGPDREAAPPRPAGTQEAGSWL